MNISDISGGDFSPEHEKAMERLRATTEIARATIDRNSVATDVIPALIASIHGAFAALDGPAPTVGMEYAPSILSA